MLPLLPFSGGAFLGFVLGANDAGNVFGTAVATRIVSFRTATILASIAIIVGAFLQGSHGMATLKSLTQSYSMTTLTVITMTAAFAVSVMTFLHLPVSASQAIIGSITGVGLATGTVNYYLLEKVIICWLATPVAAMVIACVVYFILSAAMRYIPMSILARDNFLWSSLIIVGVYGSYALGANNVANATGIFSGQFESVSDTHLALIGGGAIAAGVLTYSKRVMMMVGSGIMPLDAFTSLVAVLAMSITVHIFAMLGVPVSTSQGIIGAIIGVGIMQQSNSIHLRSLSTIVVGWIMTPVLALILSAAGFAIFVK
ncbi:MAG: anion permease [Phycisphaerae bacterium]|nr:anion permease [Phycisphaerae bacterium]